MAVSTVFEHEIYRNIGLAADTKPAGQTPHSTFFEYDTFTRYITYDGTNWVKDPAGAFGLVKEVRVSKAIDASEGAYAAGDVVNDDDCSVTATYWTFAGMAAVIGGYAAITGATLINETENQAVLYELILFNAVPTGQLTDNSANTNPVKADRAKWIGTIKFPASVAEGATVATTTQASPSTTGGLPLFYKCTSSSTTLFGVLVTKTAYTQTATDDIEIALQVVYI